MLVCDIICPGPTAVHIYTPRGTLEFDYIFGLLCNKCLKRIMLIHGCHADPVICVILESWRLAKSDGSPKDGC
jgi:hypothetical protein